MSSMRKSWFLLFIFSFLFHNSVAKHEKQLPSAMVVGTVYCDTCFNQRFSKTSHFISGASVAVECGEAGLKSRFREEVKTNEHGEFKVHLPLSVGKHLKRLKRCSVKLITSSEPYCAVASTATSSSLNLKSRKKGLHIFSAGFFTFKPLKQPELCYQKPSPTTSSKFSSMKTFFAYPDLPTFPPLNQNPPISILPPIPQLPQLPSLPTLPTLPPIPNLGLVPKQPGQPTPAALTIPTQFSDQKPVPLSPSRPGFGIPLTTNPLQPPPSLLPPNPVQPTPPLINLPPNPVQPTPPSPSPPRPILSFPFPTFPFPPFPPFPFPPSRPVFPGIPPASPSKKTSP
ncbi:uncharacterized protein LOC143846639 [Tasmannia lanceolata]|uniref:uncharacterized protein LOC143846639 n=1 Tax=Tasmannia lanceolata TaxID=3420 RepID=UPI00406356F2